jgi:hypothetical protein
MRETNNKDNVQAEGPEDYFRVRIIIIAVNATFNNISVISWRCFIGGNQRKPPTCRNSLTNYHIMLYRLHLGCARFELTTLVMTGSNCIGSCKSNNHTTTTAPDYFRPSTIT